MNMLPDDTKMERDQIFEFIDFSIEKMSLSPNASEIL